jgi:hypothetical protein
MYIVGSTSIGTFHQKLLSSIENRQWHNWYTAQNYFQTHLRFSNFYNTVQLVSVDYKSIFFICVTGFISSFGSIAVCSCGDL